MVLHNQVYPDPLPSLAGLYEDGNSPESVNNNRAHATLMPGEEFKNEEKHGSSRNRGSSLTRDTPPPSVLDTKLKTGPGM